MTWKKQRRPKLILINMFLLLYFAAFLFAAPYLAAWLHGTDTPTHDQVQHAKMLIAAPIGLPVIAVILWSTWHQRRNDKAMRRRSLSAPKLADPTHELRLDRGSADVD